MATWPSYAKVLLAGFGEQPESALISTEMDDGPAKVRRTKSRVMVKRRVTAQVATRAEYLTFMAWFRAADGANRGAAWFDWRDPVDGATKQARITAGLVEAQPVGGVIDAWRISLTLESWDA